MNEKVSKSTKSLIEILSTNNYVEFEETIKSRIIEKMAWNHYHEIEDEIKNQMNINNKTNSKNPN